MPVLTAVITNVTNIGCALDLFLAGKWLRGLVKAVFQRGCGRIFPGDENLPVFIGGFYLRNAVRFCR